MSSHCQFPQRGDRPRESEIPVTEEAGLSDAGLARIIHEANRALNVELGSMLQDDPFDVIPGEHREVILDRVRAIRMGLRPAQVHQRWADYWISRGWTAGERDPEKKTHPCLVPYDELPRSQRLKVLMAMRIIYTLTMEG